MPHGFYILIHASNTLPWFLMFIAALMSLSITSPQSHLYTRSDRDKVFFTAPQHEHVLLGSIDCAPLKEMHRTEDDKCRTVLIKAAKIFDKIITV